MYPGVYVEYDDQSDIISLPITEVRNQPLFCAVFTSDKGTEEWTRVSGEDFFKMYGKSIKFTKHGQPLLQAAMSINAGAELLCKRLVADDATLANLAIYAKVETTEATTQEVQATDGTGAPLYKDAEGNQTIEITGDPIMTTVTVPGTCKISYIKRSVEGLEVESGQIPTIKDVVDSLEKNVKTEDNEYLLYAFADIGRGVSNKRVKIVPNYKLSKGADYVTYNFSVIEGSSEVESFSFSVNPHMIINGENVSLQSMINNNSDQLVCYEDIEGIENLIKAVAEATGKTEGEILKYDVLFGCTNKGIALDGVTIDPEGIDLDSGAGQALEKGSDGAFAEHNPSYYLGSKVADDDKNVWAQLAIKAFDGSFDKIIFNLDQHKIHAVVDANYPYSVKKEIEALANFREDFMYLRDQRLDNVSYEGIKDTCSKESKSMFCATYPQFYDVIDPYSKRQITVTIGYSLARLLVNHINNGSILPIAGMKYDMVIDDAIYGTLSYAPTICPDEIGGNEKELMEDIKVNYASYIDNQLVIETLYTSQEKNSQWSYVNNVMGIQDVVKAIRTRCPAIRYTFIEGEDLEKYKADVEEVIAPYSSNYLQLSLEYKQDAMYSANKIFYAVLKVVYKDFIQTEWFKVTALSTVEVQA